MIFIELGECNLYVWREGEFNLILGWFGWLEKCVIDLYWFEIELWKIIDDLFLKLNFCF